ncbi:MAG: 4-oxalomesaconate tautomerase [Tagaea sp.]|nr:4-oxalomesaconate tautomerase [Tagaea sp.]
MDDLVRIPCVLMRGGTSKGPFFLADDLPAEPARRDAVLIAALGAGHRLQIDGIGGGNPLTSKVAIVGRSRRADADVDYLFAQVLVAERRVDTSPNCGNMLAGVGPFAIEAGLVPARAGTTTVRIRNVNTGKLIVARVRTQGGRVAYAGDATIDGVPGSAAPIHLAFLDAAGSKTDALLPSGQAVERIGGMDVTLIDAAMPLMLLQASDLGLTGGETPAEIDANRALLARIEAMRREAGHRMGLGDVADRVVPKPAILSPPADGGTIRVRYLMPHTCHTALAITGAVAIATAIVTPGTLAARVARTSPAQTELRIEHPSGKLDLRIERSEPHAAPVVSVIRTARRLFEGAVLVPPELFAVAETKTQISEETPC